MLLHNVCFYVRILHSGFHSKMLRVCVGGCIFVMTTLIVLKYVIAIKMYWLKIHLSLF